MSVDIGSCMDVCMYDYAVFELGCMVRCIYVETNTKAAVDCRFLQCLIRAECVGLYLPRIAQCK